MAACSQAGTTDGMVVGALGDGVGIDDRHRIGMGQGMAAVVWMLRSRDDRQGRGWWRSWRGSARTEGGTSDRGWGGGGWGSGHTEPVPSFVSPAALLQHSTNGILGGMRESYNHAR